MKDQPKISYSKAYLGRDIPISFECELEKHEKILVENKTGKPLNLTMVEVEGKVVSFIIDNHGDY